MPRITIKLGNIFEGGMDLSVLPCSSKGTFRSARTLVDLYGLRAPNDIGGTLKLGGITPVRIFPGKKTITQYYTWAAGVFNDASSFEAIEEIGMRLGEVTQCKRKIKNVETPLLGTGFGRLGTDASAKALTKGFAQTAHKEACLFIFAWEHERFKALTDEFSKPLWKRVLEGVSFSPGVLGFSVDVGKMTSLISEFLPRR